jgi:hypothetical protein
MANFTFNIAKGRVVEFYNRAENNDPTNSAIILVVLAVTDTEANLQDLDDLAAVLAATPNEVGAAWGASNGRKTLESVQLAALPAPDDTNNRYAVQVPQVTWTAVAAANNAVGLLVCYDSDTTVGTDSNIIPLTHHDFAVTTDGNDVILNVGDFFRAS